MTREEADNGIRQIANQSFLADLLEVGRLYGWRGDYAEISYFIEEIHEIVGVKGVDTTEYELDDD